MIRKLGEYNSGLKKLYGSLRKRYGLTYEETSSEIDEVLEDDEFGQYPVFVISSDNTYSREFIAELNAIGKVQAYGFYRDGDFPYKVITEVREALPQLIRQNDNDKFFFISVGKDSSFIVERTGTICIKLSVSKKELQVSLTKTRKTIPTEIIRKYREEDKAEFTALIDKLYYKRWEKIPEIFRKRYSSHVFPFSYTILCFRKNKIVGFLVYRYENRREENSAISMADSIITITDIYVEEEYRRQKIATRMYEEVEKIVESCKANKLRFKVWEKDVVTKMFVESLQPEKLYTMYELDV